MNILISSSAIIARSNAILDWGWKLANFSPLIFKNILDELVHFKPMTSVYALRTIEPKGKLYYVLDGLDRYPNDLDELATHIRSGQWNVIKNPANEWMV